jgi:hypothetical protein
VIEQKERNETTSQSKGVECLNKKRGAEQQVKQEEQNGQAR